VDFAESQRRPGKHPVGLIIVIVLHLLLGWALLSGLARKVVEVVKAPIETKIIEEVKPPPPPPPENLPPPPKNLPPPPAFVPPPEVQVAQPQAPTITTTNVQPPPR
jgi:protein TonB